MGLLGKKKTTPPQSQTPGQAVTPVGSGIQKIEKGMASLVDLIAPSSVEVDFRYIRIGERYFATHFMVGYPRYVSASWLEPVIDFDHTLDIGMFIYPTAASDVSDQAHLIVGYPGASNNSIFRQRLVLASAQKYLTSLTF